MKIPEEFKAEFSSTMGSIFIKNEKIGQAQVMDIRGWGYLTGCGGLNMDPDEAAEVQDQFTAWVVETLNNAVKKEKE